MNSLKRIIFFILLSHSFSPVYSNEQITFIDVDALMKQSIPGKEIIKNLNELNKKNVTFLKSKEKKIKDFENNINKQKNIISKEELKSKIDILQKVKNI